ncbi:MAG: hypothetical protein ABR527_01210 [Gemmatimonadota bacterium]
MVSLTSLWLPIALSAVAVFMASFLIHMILGYHRSDFRKLPAEDQVMEGLRAAGIPPGNYFMPHAGSPEAMKTPEYIEKKKRGPVALLTIIGAPSMGRSLVQWFVYCLVVSVFAGYVAGRALGSGAESAEVLRFAGTTAFAGYALALWQNSIWYKIAWSTTIKQTFDGLVYGLVTGAIFLWLWPT